MNNYFPICLSVILLVISCSWASAQHYQNHGAHLLCEFPLSNSNEEHIYKPYKFKKSIQSRNLNITINFIQGGQTLNDSLCADWPEAAQLAYNHAAGIWSDILDNTQSIVMDACWTSEINPGTLGTAGSNLYTSSDPDLIPNTLWPKPLFEHLLEQEIAGSDMFSSFNADIDWHFDPDTPPGAGQFDFVTVALHEMGHGLGFSGSAKFDDGDPSNGQEIDGVSGTGQIGIEVGESLLPTIFDRFADLGNETALTSLANPSIAVGTALVGGSGGLFFDEGNSDNFDQAPTHQLLTPSTYQQGTTFSHLNDPAQVMFGALAAQSVKHNPGTSTRAILESMGWNRASVVPVELISFSAKKNEGEIHLNWITESEISNDYFAVERSQDNLDYQIIGKVNGNGNSNVTNDYDFVDRSPDFGLNYYRLKQTDFNGDFEYSDVRTIEYKDEHRNVTILPNPVTEVLTLNFKQVQNRKASISIFETSGKLIRSLEMEPGGSTVKIDVQDLVSGNYYIRLIDGLQVYTKSFIKID